LSAWLGQRYTSGMSRASLQLFGPFQGSLNLYVLYKAVSPI
jgi:hypothetical protein